jgi:hypothetical protein
MLSTQQGFLCIAILLKWDVVHLIVIKVCLISKTNQQNGYGNYSERWKYETKISVLVIGIGGGGSMHTHACVCLAPMKNFN